MGLHGLVAALINNPEFPWTRREELVEGMLDMVNKGIQPNAVTLRNPDFQMLAKSYGCHAEKPASLKALAIVIKAALAADGPSLIEMTPAMVNG